MLKNLVTPLLASVALASVPALANTAFASEPASTPIIDSKAKPNPNRQYFTLSCSEGNFTGEIKMYVEYSNNGPFRSYGVVEYRITKRNGQQGGNKANINITLDGHTRKSRDAMKQDGAWHGLLMVGGTRNHNVPLDVQFIFDKSGRDPSCRTTRYI